MRLGWTLPILLILVGCGESDSGSSPDPTADGSVPTPDTVPHTVTFTDPNLEKCVREAMGVKGKANKLTPEDFKDLKQLQCRNEGIKTLDGLEFAIALEHLSLWENEVQDISALSGMTKLTSLQLGNNKVKDLTPLAKLTPLKRLGLSINMIDDLKPLAGLTALEWLTLDHNDIDQQDLGALNGLKKLKWLTLEHTKVQSSSGLSPLIKGGTQVYMGLSGASKPKPDTTILDAPALHLLLAKKGKLVPRVHTGGRVSFLYEVEGTSHATFAEYPGDVVLSRGKLRYDGVVIGDLELGICEGPHAVTCEVSIGRKLGTRQDRASKNQPIYSVALRLYRPEPMAEEPDTPKKNKELMDFALASPNQFDAGSCLFMANTGSMEILMNQSIKNPADIKYQGKTDLSERYLMNASELVPNDIMRYAVSDALYTYNYFSGSLLNTDYPFTAGYVKKSSTGSVSPATEEDDGAEFSCKYNWISELPTDWKKKLVVTPNAERTLIFLDPKLDKNSRWRVGIMNKDVVERIKWELRTKNAPVVVVYNHYLYWHASIVVGYDDDYKTGGCPMVESMLKYFAQNDASAYVTIVKDHMAKLGGCTDKGVFYVRDSIYDGGAEEPMYSYSKKYTFTKKYSKRIVLRSYNWVTYVSNHAYTIHRM
jgi:hypothetical protein